MDFNIVQSYILKLPNIDDLKRLEKIKELSQKYSETIVEEYLKRLIDRRHKTIVSAKEEYELSGIDFSFDYYINTLKKELIVEKGKPFKKVINCTGIVYSSYIGERFYSEEVLKSFGDIFRGYNNLEFDEEKGDKTPLDEELNKLLSQITNGKRAILLNNTMSALYLVVETLFKEKKVIMSLSDTFYLSQGMGIHDIVRKGGGEETLVGYINKISEKNYTDAITNGEELILYTDMFENSGEGIRKIGTDILEKLTSRATTLYITDRGYIATDSEEIKAAGLNLEEIIKKEIDINIIDVSKFIGGPEAALLIAEEEIIDKLSRNFLSSVLLPNKETKSLVYLVLKLYLEKKYNDIYINKCFGVTQEKLREKNKRFMRNIEREIGDRIEMNFFNSRLFKVNENVGNGYSFEREVVYIKPLYKNAADLEKEMRLNEPNILCWLDDDRLIFNLQLVREEEENLIIDFISKKI